MRAILAPLCLAAFLLVASAAPAWADEPDDDAGAAVHAVRVSLTTRGLPSDGPMLAAPMDPAMAGHGRRSWFVDTDAGLFVVWAGDAIGPLTANEADLVERGCTCEAELVVLPPRQSQAVAQSLPVAPLVLLRLPA